MTNGARVPFHSGYRTGILMEASINARGSRMAKMKFDRMMDKCKDAEMKEVFSSYKRERDLDE